MSPYLRAFHLYTAADRGWSWTDAIDIHHQRGAVISLPHVFLMARRVRHDWPDDWHLDLSRHDPAGDTWHVWAAAGDWRSILPLAASTRVPRLSYQRHGLPRLRRAVLFSFLPP